MKVIIYGIDSSDWRCVACEYAKNIFDELKIDYEFKRIIYRENDFPIKDKLLMDELSKRVKFTTLTLPYIFIDDELVKVGKLKDRLGLSDENSH